MRTSRELLPLELAPLSFDTLALRQKSEEESIDRLCGGVENPAPKTGSPKSRVLMDASTIVDLDGGEEKASVMLPMR